MPNNNVVDVLCPYIISYLSNSISLFQDLLDQLAHLDREVKLGRQELQVLLDQLDRLDPLVDLAVVENQDRQVHRDLEVNLELKGNKEDKVNEANQAKLELLDHRDPEESLEVKVDKDHVVSQANLVKLDLQDLQALLVHEENLDL